MTPGDVTALLDLSGVPDAELARTIDERLHGLRAALRQENRPAIMRAVMAAVRAMPRERLEEYVADADATSWAAATRRMRKAEGLHWPSCWDPCVSGNALVYAHGILGLPIPPRPEAAAPTPPASVPAHTPVPYRVLP